MPEISSVQQILVLLTILRVVTWKLLTSLSLRVYKMQYKNWSINWVPNMQLWGEYIRYTPETISEYNNHSKITGSECCKHNTDISVQCYVSGFSHWWRISNMRVNHSHSYFYKSCFLFLSIFQKTRPDNIYVCLLPASPKPMNKLKKVGTIKTLDSKPGMCYL